MTDAQLDTLEAKGLIRLAASMPEIEYLFRHWLVQDAAYGSLLKQERRELHRSVGESLEALYPDRAKELAAVLAIHFAEAGETDKALDYLVSAGQYALERNAVVEALAAFDRAAELLPQPSPDDTPDVRRRRIDVVAGSVRAGWTIRPTGDLIRALESVLPDAEALGDLERVAPIHLGIAMARMQLGERSTDPAVRRSLDRVAEIGDALHDPSLRALQLAVVGMTQVFAGPLREGVASLEEAVPLMDQRQDFIAAAFARGALAIGYARLGEFERAEAAAEHTRELAKGGDVIAQLDAVIAEAILRSEQGRLETARPMAEACLLQGEETGATACIVASSWILGDIYQREGRFEDARRTLQRGTDLALIVDRKFWRPSLQAWLGTSAAAIGDHDTAAGTWEEALETAHSIDNRYGEAGILWKRAEAAVTRGEPSAALADFAASAAILEEFGARPSLARVLRGWGEALVALGKAEGEANLRRALALFEEMGLEPEAWAIRARLDEVGVAVADGADGADGADAAR